VLARATRHLKLNREHLHILGDGRDPFCPLIDAKIGHGMQSTGRRLGRFLMTLGADFDGAPTMGTAPTSVVVVQAPPSGDGLALEGSAR
jgi:hypothetical protein